MPEPVKNNCDLGDLRCGAPCMVGYPWTGTESFVEQSTLSNNLSLKMGSSTPRHQNTKQLGFRFQFQDQDSSSTQSTCQSYPEVASAGDGYQYGGENKFSIQSGFDGTQEENSVGSILPIGGQDYAFGSRADHRHTYACFPVLYPDPFYRGLLAPFGPQTMLPRAQGLNVTSTRVPLPLDFTHDEPIYVNAKQYNAILRRRQYRAKLEAQNKLLKPRKPYLHESRHVHALKRARGPGGRFLNMKKMQESQPDGSVNGHDDLESAPCRENNRGNGSGGGGGGGACSDVTSASNSDNFFHEQKLRFSIYRSNSGGPIQTNGSIGPDMLGGTHHMFRC